MQFQGKHSLRSCFLPGIMILSQYVSLAAFSPYLSLFFFFSFFFFKGLSQDRRHVLLTLDISLSPRVYTFILMTTNIDRMTHEAQNCVFLGAQITDSFVQVRDVLQPAPPLLFTTVLTFLEKESKFCHHANSFLPLYWKPEYEICHPECPPF